MDKESSDLFKNSSNDEESSGLFKNSSSDEESSGLFKSQSTQVERYTKSLNENLNIKTNKNKGKK